MEQLTCLRTSRRAYCSHVMRILNKVEETLTKEIDDLTLTYLKTTVSQLEKKLEKITKLDAQKTELIDEPGELAPTPYYYPYTGACHTLTFYHYWVCATTVGWLLLMMHLEPQRRLFSSKDTDLNSWKLATCFPHYLLRSHLLHFQITTFHGI